MWVLPGLWELSAWGKQRSQEQHSHRWQQVVPLKGKQTRVAGGVRAAGNLRGSEGGETQSMGDQLPKAPCDHMVENEAGLGQAEAGTEPQAAGGGTGHREDNVKARTPYILGFLGEGLAGYPFS